MGYLLFGSFEKVLSPIKVGGFLQLFKKKIFPLKSQRALGGVPLSEFSFEKIFPKKVGGGL